MYSALPIRQPIRSLLFAFALVVVAATLFRGDASSPWAYVRLASFLAGAVVLVGWFLLGTSFRWSPWRIVWRRWPILNEWLLPDINGTWLGTTQSNYSVISTIREAAEQGEAIDLEKLNDIDLKKGAIAMEVKVSFFRIFIRSTLEDTDGISRTLAARATREPDTNEISISYVFQQNTPEPKPTDEGTHIGAAMLKIAGGKVQEMSGEYWTRRSWRQAMNTAGIIEVRRVTDNHAPRGADLLKYARSIATS